MAMICNAYGAWTWEGLRRHPAYIKLYNSLVDKGLETVKLGDNTLQITASRSYPELKKWGLLLPANPELDAHKANVFWHPNVFKSVVRFHIVDADNVDDKSQYIKLSDYPATRTHFKDADGSYHIRLMGENFWFQMQCDDIDLSSENVLIGVEFNRISDMEKRVKTASELFGIYDGSIAKSEPLHLPKRVDLNQICMIAYDVRESGGTWKEVMIALFGKEIIENSGDDYGKYWQTSRNAYTRAERYIYGDFLKTLDNN
ncbi:hypothetical protein JYT95_01155 [bacterium AH-315-J23]|nr:hypothetical protein [bacterium AH-315-J23]PHQ60906.1 MAG: hypothetical protein COC03_00730 [Robiginitomaculum sp.]